MNIKEKAEKLYLCVSDLERLCLLEDNFNEAGESAAVLSMLERGWLRRGESGMETTELGAEIQMLAFKDYEEKGRL
jgi:hypothetical protein